MTYLIFLFQFMLIQINTSLAAGQAQQYPGYDIGRIMHKEIQS